MSFAAALPKGLGTALTIGSTIFSATGAMSAANAQASASEYNAAVANRNAMVADQNRKLSIQQSRIDAEDKRRANRRVMASIRAQYGASGLALSGSPLDVLEDTAAEQELDAKRIEYEGRARGREGALQMLGFKESADLSRTEARYARSGGRRNALGIGLSGAGTLLSRMT